MYDLVSRYKSVTYFYFQFFLLHFSAKYSHPKAENSLYVTITYLLTYLLPYLLTPWSRVLLEKLTSKLCR